MCTGKCPDPCIRIDKVTKQLFYMDGCNRVNLPANALIDGGSPIGGGSPIPPSDNPTPSSNLACFKANGAWLAIENFMDATFPIIDDLLNAIPLFGTTAAYIKFQRTHPEIDEDNAHTLAYFTIATGMGVDGINGSGIAGDHGAKEHWEIHRETIKNDFICAMQDAFDKSDRLSDSDISAIFDYEFDTPEHAPYNDKEYLDSLLNYAIPSLEKAYYKKLAYAAVTSQEGTCDCAGSEPTPPPATEPEEGEFGFYPGIIVNALNTSTSPNEALAQTNPFGTKIDERNYETTELAGGNDSNGYLFVMWKATEDVKEVALNFLHQYVGTPSDNTQVVYFGGYILTSTGDDDNFAEPLNNFSSNNDNQSSWGASSPSNNMGLDLPWQGVDLSTVKWVGLSLRYQLSRANSPTPEAKGLLKNLIIKAKAASGGNYQASIIPGQFVEKSI